MADRASREFLHGDDHVMTEAGFATAVITETPEGSGRRLDRNEQGWKRARTSETDAHVSEPRAVGAFRVEVGLLDRFQPKIALADARSRRCWPRWSRPPCERHARNSAASLPRRTMREHYWRSQAA